MLPALFVSHGSPTLPLDDCAAHDFLSALGRKLPRPSAILVVSAHWDTDVPALNAVVENETIHDFSGFPQALYEMRYDAPGAPAVAARLTGLLENVGFSVRIDSARGLDHGAWVPAMLMYPEAEIPVLQLSIQTKRGAAHHIALGHALRPFRKDGLILASGGFVHNLRSIEWQGGIEPEWSRRFADWMHTALEERRENDLIAYRLRAPEAARAHPTEDHLFPLFVAYGAGEETTRIHSSVTFGSLRMDAYRFD